MPRAPFWIQGPALLQMAAIFGASSIPDLTRLPGGISDHTGHFIGDALLGAVAVAIITVGALGARDGASGPDAS